MADQEDAAASSDYEELRLQLWTKDYKPVLEEVKHVDILLTKLKSTSFVHILYKKKDSDNVIIRGGYYRKHDDTHVWLSPVELMQEVQLRSRWLQFVTKNIQAAYVSKAEANRIITSNEPVAETKKAPAKAPKKTASKEAKDLDSALDDLLK